VKHALSARDEPKYSHFCQWVNYAHTLERLLELSKGLLIRDY